MTSIFDRTAFPMLGKVVHGKPLVYFDSAATALKPECVMSAMTRFYHNSYATVHRGAYFISLESTQLFHESRELVSKFLNCKSPEEVVFTRGTTEGINLVARSYGDTFIQEGDEIIISAQEHHANIVPWQLLCERKKSLLKVIPLKEDGQIDLDQALLMVTEKTKFIAITHISNVLGVENRIELLIKKGHSVGAKVLIDAAQSVVHLAIDVQKLDCDFLVFSAHKIYGPTGVGILYGKKEVLEKMPPYQGGGDMIKTVSFEKTTYQDPPLRFEAGTPMIAEVIGLKAALTYFMSHDIKGIQEHEHQLIKIVVDELSPYIHILGPSADKRSLVSFYIDGIHSLDLATLLDIQGIAMRSGHLCAQPLLNHFHQKEVIRLSVAPYNTLEEIMYFCDQFKAILRFLRS